MKKKLASAKAPLPKFRSDKDAAEYFEAHSVAGLWDELPEVRPSAALLGPRADCGSGSTSPRQNRWAYQAQLRMWIAEGNVAKELQKAGYQTAMIGKRHLQTDPDGFDHWNILPGQGVYYDPFFINPNGRKKYGGYCTDLVADFSLDWLKQRDTKKPFFLMCHHKAPHRPWEPAPKYAKLFDGETIPEPYNLFDHYQGKPRSVAAVQMKIGENSTTTDVKTDKPAGLAGDELRRWAYRYFIEDYLRCVQSTDDNVGRLLDYLDSEHLTTRSPCECLS